MSRLQITKFKMTSDFKSHNQLVTRKFKYNLQHKRKQLSKLWGRLLSSFLRRAARLFQINCTFRSCFLWDWNHETLKCERLQIDVCSSQSTIHNPLGWYISLTPSPWTTTNGLPKWTTWMDGLMDYPKLTTLKKKG